MTILSIEETPTEDLLDLAADGLATDTVRLGAAIELIRRLYAKETS